MMQDGLTKLTTSNLFLGEIVFKAKAPGEDGYALPDKYKSGSDLTDYLHVGIVTSVKPLVITHCTGVVGGIARDNKLGKWKFGGKLKGIIYGKEVVPMCEEATVVGGKLNLRKNPSSTAAVIVKIPDGSKVSVIEKTNGEWWKCDYNGNEGYCMCKYLSAAQDNVDTISVNKIELENIYNAIGNLLGLRG